MKVFLDCTLGLCSCVNHVRLINQPQFVSSNAQFIMWVSPIVAMNMHLLEIVGFFLLVRVFEFSEQKCFGFCFFFLFE